MAQNKFSSPLSFIWCTFWNVYICFSGLSLLTHVASTEYFKGYSCWSIQRLKVRKHQKNWLSSTNCTNAHMNDQLPRLQWYPSLAMLRRKEDIHFYWQNHLRHSSFMHEAHLNVKKKVRFHPLQGRQSMSTLFWWKNWNFISWECK